MSVHARITNPPRMAGLRVHRCARCSHEDLSHPVWLDVEGRVSPYGTRCAAILLGLAEEASSQSKAFRAVKQAQEEFERAERAERWAGAKVEEDSWQVFLDATAGPAPNRFTQIVKLGGFAKARAAWRATVNQEEECR